MPPSRPPCDRPIVLVGMMGAGKSTVGRLLAARLGLPFVDADEEVERETGLTIAENFRRFGEPRFREIEREVVARLAMDPPQVVAIGGGAFADDATRGLILRRCTAVWLDADVETLAGRVAGDDTRPLIAGKDPHPALAALAEQRSPAYAQAQVRVCSAGTTPERVTEAVLEALAERVR